MMLQTCQLETGKKSPESAMPAFRFRISVMPEVATLESGQQLVATTPIERRKSQHTLFRRWFSCLVSRRVTAMVLTFIAIWVDPQVNEFWLLLKRYANKH